MNAIGFLLLWIAIWFAFEKSGARSRTQAEEAVLERVDRLTDQPCCMHNVGEWGGWATSKK